MVSKVSVDLTTPVKEAILQTAAFADLLLAYMEQPSKFKLENASVADQCVKPLRQGCMWYPHRDLNPKPKR